MTRLMLAIAVLIAVIGPVAGPVAADEVVVAPDGKVIRLKPDGTWEFVLDVEGNAVRQRQPLGLAEPTAIRMIPQEHDAAALERSVEPGAVGVRIVGISAVPHQGCFVTVAAFNNSADRFMRFYPEIEIVDRNDVPLGHIEPKFKELQGGQAVYIEELVRGLARCDQIAAAKVRHVYACTESSTTRSLQCGDGRRAVQPLPDGVIPLVN